VVQPGIRLVMVARAARVAHAPGKGKGSLFPLLQLDEGALIALIPRGGAQDYPKASVVIQEGDLTDSLYIILSGRVKVFLSEEGGKEYVLSVIGAGDYFGEVALDGGPRSASIMTLEACRFFIVPKAEVRTLVEQHPDFARNLIGRLIRKVRSLSDSVHNLALLSVYCRLLRLIDEQAVQRDDGRRITERLTQQDIASRVGASREMVSRLIADLSNCGYIAIENKCVVVLRDLPEY
jgi:CRP/FNR family cyclic AMP-dependent transcriptional regulator